MQYENYLRKPQDLVFIKPFSKRYILKRGIVLYSGKYGILMFEQRAQWLPIQERANQLCYVIGVAQTNRLQCSA